uniref:Progonadoliberin-1 n=1 Tax=Rachycentron canadum TaxID=141264 RepID=Q6B6M2_RACCA|nr:seabream-type gonadotropin-releasing hormone precursor [Rachycentron canadum]
MGVKTLALWLLFVGTLVPQHWCQHWSYGLSPGGKRELDSLSDTLANMVEGVPHVDSPCSILRCAEDSPFPKIYRMKGFLGSVTDRENGRRTYQKL